MARRGAPEDIPLARPALLGGEVDGVLGDFLLARPHLRVGDLGLVDSSFLPQ